MAVGVGKEDAMRNERIVSIGAKSMIYHKPGCRYVDRIKYKNRMSLSKQDAKNEGYHTCKYCNSMNYHCKAEQPKMDFYSKKRNLQFNYIDKILYVKSEIGCWKLVYMSKAERIALYHRNTIAKPLDFKHPQYEPYHRQVDNPHCNSIAGILDYIYEHDKYKATIARGEKVTRFSSKKYERHEAKAEKKRQRSRVDYLFRMIEKQNSGYKELSFC